MSETKYLLDTERDIKGFQCECGGYAASVPVTKDEVKKYDCGRGVEYVDGSTELGFACCAVAFVCQVCGQRYAGEQDAPDVDDYYY